MCVFALFEQSVNLYNTSQHHTVIVAVNELQCESIDLYIYKGCVEKTLTI